MASTNNTEAEKWKTKYYGLLDKFEKQESDWTKSEKLLATSLSRLSLVAEGENPLVDHHLQALRVVLKEKFNHYRVESVLTELFKLVTEINKKPKNKKQALIESEVIAEILDAVNLPKEFQKKKTLLIKELKKSPSDTQSIVAEFRTLFKEAAAIDSNPETSGFLSRLFSNKSKSAGPDSLALLSNAIVNIPWPSTLESEAGKLASKVKTCGSNKELDEVLTFFTGLLTQWKETPGISESGKQRELIVDKEKNQHPDTIKLQFLNQFIKKLKSIQPSHKNLQSIELSESNLDAEPDHLAESISRLIIMRSGVEQQRDTSTDDLSNVNMPKLREIFIQLLEQLVVPVALLAKVEKLKHYLETGEDKDWRLGLKKIVQFINEVRFQEYQEEGEYENFLQQITGRLQEMVVYLENQNKEIEESGEKGNELNRAMTKEVDGMRQGLESAVTLAELQSVVNNRLDAISSFMMQHSELEQHRYGFAKENLQIMQEKINHLEDETAELKVNLENKNREAMYDALTAIPNRLFYEKRVKEDIARWKRFDTPLSIAVWDVDKFKSVNDTYGHKAGDKVLKAIAQILNKRIRETDFLARYGGEEFVMLLPGTVEEETLRLANELRKAVEECAFHYNNEAVNITISCGISGFRTGDTLGVVFERADKALYQAKESGRNRCVVAGCRSD